MADDPIFGPIDIDPATFRQVFDDQMQATFPGWQPNDAEPDDQIGEAVSQMAAQVAELASVALTNLTLYWGGLLNVSPLAATSASGTATFTLLSNPAGRTIEAGTSFVVTDPDGVTQTFEVAVDTDAAATVLSAPGVAVTAVATGSAGSGLSGAGTLLTSVSWLSQTVTLDAVTTGGEDAETIDEYLPRFAAEAELLTGRPILPPNFATIARRVNEVARALVIDGLKPTGSGNNLATYDPANMATWVDRAVTVVPMATDGAAISAGGKTALDGLFNGPNSPVKREVNFLVALMDPQTASNAVTITFTAAVLEGFDAAATIDQAEAAVTDFLSAANWGIPPGQPGYIWKNKTKVRRGDIFAAIKSVDGIWEVTALTINGSSTADFSLTGLAPVPAASPSVTGTAA